MAVNPLFILGEIILFLQNELLNWRWLPAATIQLTVDGEREPQFIDGEGEGEEGEEEARNKKKSRGCENNFSFVREYGTHSAKLKMWNSAEERDELILGSMKILIVSIAITVVAM